WRELSFHPHEIEVRGTNFHFILTKLKFAARTSVSSPRNGSSWRELSFHRHEMEVHGANFHFNKPPRRLFHLPTVTNSKSNCSLDSVRFPWAQSQVLAHPYSRNLRNSRLICRRILGLIWTSCCKVVTAGRQEDCIMQDMTPEERFTKIENLLATVAQCQAMQMENQARRDAEIDKHNAVIEKH